MKLFISKLLISMSLFCVYQSSSVCNSDLLYSYGIHNPQYLNQSSVFCQNDARESCCSNEDLSQAVENWNDRFVKTVQPFYELTEFLYKAIFQVYEDIIIESKYAYWNPKTSKECREAAEFLIMSYLDSEEIEKFVSNLEKSHTVLEEIRRGFFCNLCSVKNQKYFDTDLKKVLFSYDACEDLIEHTIDTVAFNINKIMPIFANINKHLNCQLDSNVNEDDQIFTIKEKRYVDINRCFSFVAKNQKKLPSYDHCSSICLDFSLVKPSKIFEGALKPMVIIKEKMERLKMNGTDPIFEDFDATKSYDVKKLERFFFESQLSFQDLAKYEPIYQQYGLRPLDDSENALFFYSSETGLDMLEKDALILKMGVVMFIAFIFNW